MPTSSAPAGASGVPSNNIPTAQAYQPMGQPGVDAGLLNIMQQFPQNPSQTPAGSAYPTANNLASWLADPNNAYFNEAIAGAQNASNQYTPFNQFATNTFDALGNYQPTIAPNMANAQQIANYAPQVASEAGGLLNFLGTDATQEQNLVPGGAANLFSAGNSILNTAFDPQNALFNQLSNQVQQQANAANAAAGLGGSAYGAGNTSNTLSNFDINWQNQQLARQSQGISGANAAYGGGTGLLAAPSQLLSSGLQAANGALAGAQNLNASPGASLSALLAPLFSGAQGAGNILSSGASFSGLPFQQQAAGVNQMLGGLQSGVNIGNNQYTVPQQLINDAQSYLGLGQAASSLSGQLGQLGQNQLFNSLSGLGGAANLGSQLLTGNSLGNTFGSGGLLGSLGIGGGSSGAAPFGTGFGADFGGGADFAAPALASGGFDAGGAALAGAADFGGGADFLPLLALA